MEMPSKTATGQLLKRRILCLALLAQALAVAGCGDGSRASATAAPPPTVITALVWAPDWPQEMHHIAAAFTRAHPDIKVNVQFMIGNSVEENLKPRVASNQLPDLISVNPNAYAAGLAAQGLLADVSGTAAWSNMLDLLKPDWTTANGQHFGIASGVAATLIYYNKAMFQQAGVHRLPTNFDEFLAACALLKKAGLTPLILDGGFPNMLGNGPFSYGFANNVAAARPDWRRQLASGQLDLDTAETADIFAKIKLLAARGYVQHGYMNTSYDQGIRLFAEGKAAMAFEGSWAAGRLLGGKKVDAGVFIPPWNAAGKTVVPVVGSETGFAVCNTRNRAAAMLLLEFMANAGYPIQQNARHNISSMKRVDGHLLTDPQLSAYMQQVSQYASAVPPYYAFLPANSIETLHPLLQDVLSGKITPRQAARKLDASVRSASAAGRKD